MVSAVAMADKSGNVGQFAFCKIGRHFLVMQVK
jgi:hypothetical protein